ncbi:hypothetical protein P5P86_08360 [Nocardioides sp. BP30]|uniref:hypothetical protein n=1 Tax=Nocardioides sp. BP30 TaxID=3036374 RepID=UPI002468EBA0|nr:hypothetical protein [Nocardioides sp. BP30]WGL53829.1 hypothetical protein P5P86_08360 [Nocardioides sp. BP30]
MPRSAGVSFPVFGRRLVLLVATAVAACTSPAQGDTWWALRAGRDIWHRRTVSLTDRYSYTAYGDRWPDHEWLWQVLAYALHAVGGLPLLTLAVGLIAGGTLALSTAAGEVRRTDLVVLILAVPGVIGGWALRPQVLSMLLFALTLWLLRNRRWWWCVPVMLVWANAHGGVVFGGLALGSACVAALWHRRHLPVLLVVTALGALATLATPLGTGLWHYVLTSGSRPFEERITEWRPAYEHLTFYTLAFWVWVGLTVLALAVRRRRLGTFEAKLGLVSTLAVLPLAIDANRNMTMFVLAATPLLVVLLRRERPAVRAHDTVPFGRPVLAGAAVVAAVVTALVYLAPPDDLGWHPMSTPVARAIERCPGHVYTSYDSGAYLIWFTPQVPVFADNRQDPYPERILDLSVLAADSPYVGVFEQYDVRCAALLSWGTGAVDTLHRDGWTTALDDDGWVVLTAPGTTLARALTSAS